MLKLLTDNGIEIISVDLLDIEKLNSLPEVENIIYMAGRKFGTDGQEPLTWAMNSTLPAFVAYKFRKSNIVVFSSGNIYPKVPTYSGGCTEAYKTNPVGEYAMSCLARECAFEYAALQYQTNVFIYRLNYALDLRYLKELDSGTGVTENAIRVMVKRGDIPAIKVGCKSLINIGKLIEFLEIQTTVIEAKNEKDDKYNMRKVR